MNTTFIRLLLVDLRSVSGGLGESGPDSPSLSGIGGGIAGGRFRVNAGPYRGCPRVFDHSPLTGPQNKNDKKKKLFFGHKKKARVPPPRPRGLGGGTPHSGRSPELNQPLKS